jgi:DNA-directed RNA polymerase
MNNFITEIIDSNDYIQIKYILENKELTLEEKQLRIENFIFNNWVDNLLEKLQNKDTTKIYSSNIGLDILKYSIKSISNALDNYKENRKYSKGKIYFTFIKLVNTNDLISITLRNVIPIIFNYNDLNEQKVISLFEKVGKEIVNNLCLNAYELYKKDNNINLTNKIIIKLKSNLSYIDFKDIIIDSIINYNKDLNNIIDIKEDLFYLIGGDIVEFLSKNSDLYKITIKKSNNISHRFILPDSIISDLICKHMIYANQKLPMIVKPINWKLDDTNNDNILTYGGYLTNLNNKNHYIHKSHKNVGITKLINNDNIDCINYLQSIPFIINKELLNYLIDCINNNFDFNNLLPLELHSETNNLYKYILKKDNILINNILSNNSKFNENRSYLSLAMLLQDYTFYHPLFMDWRGRIYTNSNVLSFQSSELSRSLIMFKYGVVLNKKGIESLQIYLANCFGLNKKSFSDRLN